MKPPNIAQELPHCSWTPFLSISSSSQRIAQGENGNIAALNLQEKQLRVMVSCGAPLEPTREAHHHLEHLQPNE